MTDQNTTDQAASSPEPNPVDLATYDSRAYAALPGVDVSGSYASRPAAHLIPAPVAPVAPGDLAPAAEEAAREEPAVVPAKPEPVRVPVKAPAEDGQVARAYLSPRG